MPARRTRSVRHRRLGAELRRLREAHGLTIDQVADTLECSNSKVSRIEIGRVSATPRDVRDMLDIYGISGQQRDGLIQLARDARQKGWWHQFRDLPIATLVGLEESATSIRAYRELLVPGWLQTEEYARAILTEIFWDRPEEVDRRVDFRMEQQQRLLAQEDSPQLWAILDEAVIRRSVGKPGVMTKQLKRLKEVAGYPRIRLQILPFSAGEHAGMDGGFTIVTFSDVAEPDVVYLEHTTSDLYLEDPQSVERYARLFDRLESKALHARRSRRFLTQALEVPT
jgi:transcriptional regulator with XRE-family HTH domain